MHPRDVPFGAGEPDRLAVLWLPTSPGRRYGGGSGKVEEEPRSDCLDEVANALGLVGADIVEHDDVARPEFPDDLQSSW